MGIKPLLASEIIAVNKRHRRAPILVIAAVSVLLVGCSGGNSGEPAAGSDKTTTTSRSNKQSSSTGATGSSGATYATGAAGISTTSTTARNGSTTTKGSSTDNPADPATVSTTRAAVTTTTRASVTTTTTAAPTTTTTRPVVPGAAAVSVSKGPSTSGCASGSACAYLDVLLTNFTPGQLVTVQCSGTKSSGSFSIASFSAEIGPDGSFNTGLISPCKHGVAGQYVYATVGTVHATHLRW